LTKPAAATRIHTKLIFDQMNYIGIDIIEIDRIQKAIDRWGESFLQRVYTDAELAAYCKQLPSLAARFAGKEAVIKALGISTKGIGMKEIEILSDPNGKPVVQLYGKMQNQASSLGLNNLAISLSHSKEYAIALVAGEAK